MYHLGGVIAGQAASSTRVVVSAAELVVVHPVVRITSVVDAVQPPVGQNEPAMLHEAPAAVWPSVPRQASPTLVGL